MDRLIKKLMCWGAHAHAFIDYYCIFRYKSVEVVKCERDEARAYVSIKKVCVPQIETKEDVFCVLHELGHIYHRHYSVKNTPLCLFKAECLAWNYAAKCTNKKYLNDFIRHAIKCLDTYNQNRFKDHQFTPKEMFVNIVLASKLNYLFFGEDIPEIYFKVIKEEWGFSDIQINFK